jgi:formylglycine-generating enzyme required for sulfatase activity
MKTLALLAAAALLALEAPATAEGTLETKQVRVGAGTYRPLFPPSPSEAAVDVRAFLLDETPVTNAQFLAFVTAHPEWRRDRVPPVFAERGYLEHWSAPDAFDAATSTQPVVDVSWFAARAFCAARGSRLPTTAEWELAAAASRTSADGTRDAAWRNELLATYSRPAPSPLPSAGASAPNFWGVRDLHGVVWEWVKDFDIAARAFASGSERLPSCGAVAGAATDTTDFPAFQRAALRSSLAASYRTKTLGFRCARDLSEGAPR